MKRAVLIAVMVSLVVLAFAAPALAAKPGPYWPGGTKPTVIAVPVTGGYEVTLQWPAAVLPVLWYGAGWDNPTGGIGVNVGLANSITFVETLAPGHYTFWVSALAPDGTPGQRIQTKTVLH